MSLQGNELASDVRQAPVSIATAAARPVQK